MRYVPVLDFECEDEPPTINVWDEVEDVEIMTIHLEPKLCDSVPNWSDESCDWELPEQAVEILEKMNCTANGFFINESSIIH